jgi:hypothetical protein
LVGNEDSEYKRTLLDKLTTSFRVSAMCDDTLPLPVEPFDFIAALVVFSEYPRACPP